VDKETIEQFEADLKLKLRIGHAVVGAGVDCDARDRKHKPRILHACFT